MTMRAAFRCLGATVGLAVAATTAHAFDLQGHRGARGHLPENTLPAFELAITQGVATLETDLALTKDGHLVLTHDPLLNPDLVRGADGQWVQPGTAVRTLTLQEVRQLDVGRLKPETAYAKTWATQQPRDGARMPALAELFELVRRSPRALRLNIEVKLSPAKPDETASPEAFATAVSAAVRASGFAERITVQSFDWRALTALKAVAPEIRTACLTIETERTNNVRPASGPSWTAGLKIDDHGGSLPRLVKAAGCSTWSPFWRNVDAARIADAKANGLATIPWTVNDAAEMGRLIDLGVDGLITDYPDRATPVLAAKGKTVR
jgi:glycerophosphoryl diester phosphodiesterase